MPLFRRFHVVAVFLLLIGSARLSHAQPGVTQGQCGADPDRSRVCAVDDSIGLALIDRDTTALDVHSDTAVMPSASASTRADSVASDRHARTGFAFDVAFGSATGNGGNFLGRDLTSARYAAGVRHVGSNHLGLFGDIGLEWLAHTGDYVSICVFDSHGECVGRYPTLAGLSALVGVIAQRGDVLEMRAGIGGAAFNVSSAGRGTVAGAAMANVDVSVFPVSHLGILFGMRGILVPSYRGDRLTMAPWSIGVRVR